ncbi:hypothetical protein AAGG74_17315 [Bacillus mexicanus]|uniref:hypothetical protein n=1 Tax=Bacillus mexicanus TaxID=2834415 RepID=UPI003D23929F
MNYPILINSKHNLSTLEIKRYVESFGKHKVTFSQVNKFELHSHHLYEDRLEIVLLWNISQEPDKKERFYFPRNKHQLDAFEKQNIIHYKCGEIQKFSSESKFNIPSEKCYQLFHNKVRTDRKPLGKKDYKYFEYTCKDSIKTTTDIDTDFFSKEMDNYKLFYEFIKRQNQYDVKK